MNLRLLIVGDLHLRHQDLETVAPLLDFIIEQSELHDGTINVGDLMHNHGVERADVLAAAMKYARRLYNPWFLVGNHDLLSDEKSSHMHAVNIVASESGTDRVLFHPTTFSVGGVEFGAIPFMRSAEEFEAVAAKFEGKTPIVFCHQEFNGCTYENGFFSKHGAKLECFSGKFISGHIHLHSVIGGRLFYVGSPRWMTSSDAGQSRVLWTLTVNERGEMISMEPISVVGKTPVYRHLVVPASGEFEIPADYQSWDKVFAEYDGSDDTVTNRLRSSFPKLVLKSKPKIRAREASVVSESKGFFQSVSDVVSRRNDLPISQDEFMKVIQERLT